MEKLAGSGYRIKGEIIEVTSVELAEGGAAARRPITLDVDKIEGSWLITAVQLGPYEGSRLSLMGKYAEPVKRV